MESKILIFDGECPYCNLASETVQSINDEVMVIDWQDDVVQEFLELQFDTTPFSMVFADLEDSEVTVGDAAAGRVADNSKVTKPMSSLVLDNYDKISSVVSFLSQRDRSTDEEYYGTYELDEAAEQKLEELD